MGGYARVDEDGSPGAGAGEEARAPIGLTDLRRLRRERRPIVCLTAYDATFARLVDRAGVDLVLVGDSLGMVVQGHDSTVPVSVDDMVYHTRLVARGLRRAFLVADMPFASYATVGRAVRHAARLLQEGGARMVKLESARRQVEIVRALTDEGIPVCAHLGLRPQSVYKSGGFRVAGKKAEERRAIEEDALRLAEAGADLLLLECVPPDLAAAVARASPVPVIGIGAGAEVDGQILVLYDILGLGEGRRPRFAKDYLAASGGSILEAVRLYVAEVRGRIYPGPEHVYGD
jgi:3-methyl-2-oxobutanoate hydroxymethyltransferase